MPQGYLAASDGTLQLLVSQAERRLEAQMEFAAAADQRAAVIASAGTALSVGAAAVSAQALGGGPGPLFGAALMAASGFAIAAYFAMDSTRCLAFHPLGYRPSDFLPDIRAKKRLKLIFSEIAEDLDERLAFNTEVLHRRGVQSDRAFFVLIGTPVAALVTSMLWVGAELLFK